MRKKAVNEAYVRCLAFEVYYSLYVINDQLKHCLYPHPFSGFQAGHNDV